MLDVTDATDLGDSTDATADLIETMRAARMTIGVAESLTGGLVTAELTRIPGASAVVNGGVVAYHTELKSTLLGVDVSVLAVHGAVHPDVALQMAVGVRTAVAVDGRRADIGVATTGVAGPDSQDGQEPGTVFIGVSMDGASQVVALQLAGDRASIRSETVVRTVEAVRQLIAQTLAE
ncbi:CinA family protein [Glaciibacter psychrotolerans]|uniref:Nicotinamide-nucleotide amidase n=1 Tax=Glaciibacter psychrotolerans TaxID=670054 RepID=A0A7Z0J4T3_9MICO|nr:nicotinamide-nucleotide amidohydrolase family protein [Leifsonia psychrotolerans]NYJ18411.1 nicotinamide-nucleotide amidase [Leifsonia psychrotolerans]